MQQSYSYVSYDIETVANDRSTFYWDKVPLSAPRTYKDKEKIDNYVTAKRAEMRRKSALFWWTAQVVCISVVDGSGRPKVFTSDNETRLLNTFFDYVETLNQTSPLPTQFIGKNSKDFDSPMIVGRSLANKVPIHPSFKQHKLRDVDEMFSFSRSSSQIGKLGDYAWGLDFKGKTGSGSSVEGLWNKIIMGDDDARVTLEEYCLQDSMIVHEMLSRYSLPYGEQSDTTPLTEDDIPF